MKNGLRQVWTSNGRHFSDARQASASQEDLGLPLQFICSQEAKVIADHFMRTTSVLRDSTVLGEFWSNE